ncbi:redox-sensing transcriptional repressor Rex [Lentisphaerota bacterium WC36G]|nr:redox-sensing transcriptional repressor Rex [Lentisphaerae bacterium WC36]
MSKNKLRKIAKLPSIRRMPQYLHIAKRLHKEGQEVVSTTFLAKELGVEPIVARKDLEITNVVGQSGIGYKIIDLIDSVETFLGWNNNSDAFLVGVGAMGSALLKFNGFENYGINILAGFDISHNILGIDINGRKVFHIDSLPNLARRMKVNIGILCVPEENAQEVADMMIRGGIRAIWNFTPTKLTVPDNVVVQREVLASGLAVLSVKLGKLFAEEKESGC